MNNNSGADFIADTDDDIITGSDIDADRPVDSIEDDPELLNIDAVNEDDDNCINSNVFDTEKLGDTDNDDGPVDDIKDDAELLNTDNFGAEGDDNDDATADDSEDDAELFDTDNPLPKTTVTFSLWALPIRRNQTISWILITTLTLMLLITKTTQITWASSI